MNGRGAADAHLVVAGIVVRRDRVLLCHRSSERAWFPVWDLPGGHVENGETHTGALVRELHEELGIVTAEPAELDAVRVVTSEFDLSVWVIGQWAGQAGNAAPREHDDVSLFLLGQVSSLHLADASYVDLLTNALAGPP
jgi:mutator protein MutT